MFTVGSLCFSFIILVLVTVRSAGTLLKKKAEEVLKTKLRIEKKIFNHISGCK